MTESIVMKNNESEKNNTPVNIHLMGSEYHVVSPIDEVSNLEKAAHSLDQRMNEIKASGRIVGLERIAVMAALNLSYELMFDQKQLIEKEQIDSHIQKLQEKINFALEQVENIPS
jgi:cell division protein ZapA